MVMVDSVLSTLQPELKSGERVLWSGIPGQGIRFQPADAIMIPFSLMWGGFAFFWEYMVLTETNAQGGHAPVLFGLWGIPFCLIGLYMIVGRFFYESYRRAHTYYAVTDQRIIIVSGAKTRQVKSFSLQNLGEITLDARADGSGNITFGSGASAYTNTFGNYRRGMPKTPSFEMITEVRKVYDIILSAQNKKAS